VRRLHLGGNGTGEELGGEIEGALDGGGRDAVVGDVGEAVSGAGVYELGGGLAALEEGAGGVVYEGDYWNRKGELIINGTRGRHGPVRGRRACAAYGCVVMCFSGFWDGF
jgi:hypothetical protein